MEIPHISRSRYLHTMWWAVLLAALVVALAATVGRAFGNIKAALTDKPDIAVYLLLEDEGVTNSKLLRSKEGERDYLVDTKSGQKLVKLKKGEEEWFVAHVEPMRE